MDNDFSLLGSSSRYLGPAEDSTVSVKGNRLLSKKDLECASLEDLERELLYYLEHWEGQGDASYMLTNVVNIYNELSRKKCERVKITAQQAKVLDGCLKVAQVASRPIVCETLSSSKENASGSESIEASSVNPSNEEFFEPTQINHIYFDCRKFF